ncbi:hypothetical protein [Lysinibacillus endophyticus]|uniref:hypothetical protein n=1 Tax=Ureibacillus endophyticus TaxID=1978490 RepID=UPI0031357DF2
MGIIQRLVLERGVKVEISRNVKIDTLVVPEGEQASSFISNFGSLMGNISRIETSTGQIVPIPPSIIPPYIGDDSDSSFGVGGTTTPPKLSNVTSSPVVIGGTVTATSNKSGFLYLVPKTTTKSVTALNTAAAGSNGVRVPVSANVATTLSTSGFEVGIYVVYAVDANGNISVASSDIVVRRTTTTASEELAGLVAKTTVNVADPTDANAVQAALVDGLTVEAGYTVTVAEYAYDATAGTATYKLVVTNDADPTDTATGTAVTTTVVDTTSALEELAGLVAKTTVNVADPTDANAVQAALVDGLTVEAGYTVTVAEYAYDATAGTATYKLVVTNDADPTDTATGTAVTTTVVDTTGPKITSVTLTDAGSEGFGNDVGDVLYIIFSEDMGNTTASLDATDLEDLFIVTDTNDYDVDEYNFTSYGGNSPVLQFVMNGNVLEVRVLIANDGPYNPIMVTDKLTFGSITSGNLQDLEGNIVDGFSPTTIIITTKN